MRTIRFLSILATLAAMGSQAFASVHSVYRCDIQDGTQLPYKKVLYFAYDAQGDISNAKAPGYCKLTSDAFGNTFGSYFCWVADTQTASTTDGQLAIQFKDGLGDRTYLFTQLNVPANIRQLKAFTGTRGLTSRGVNLTNPIPSARATKMDCQLVNAQFKD